MAIETFAMLTVDQVREMAPAERLELFDAMVEEVFTGAGVVGQVSDALDIARQSYSRWHREPASLPAWPILLLQEWAWRKRLSVGLARLPFGDDPAQP